MNETLKWTLWILGGLVASLVSGFIFVWMTMGYKVKTPLRIRILSFPFLIGGIPFAVVACCTIMIVQHFSGTNVKREGEPVMATANKDDVKSFVKDHIRKCIAVSVYNAIYVDKEKCDSQVEFSDIVKKATKQVVPVEFDDGAMKITLEDFERESIALGDVTVSQLNDVKSGNFKFVLRCDDNDPNLTTIETMRVLPNKGD